MTDVPTRQRALRSDSVTDAEAPVLDGLHSLEQLARLRQRIIEIDEPPAVADRICSWVLAKWAGHDDLTSSDTRSRYRKILRRVGGPDGTGGGDRFPWLPGIVGIDAPTVDAAIEGSFGGPVPEHVAILIKELEVAIDRAVGGDPEEASEILVWLALRNGEPRAEDLGGGEEQAPGGAVVVDLRMVCAGRASSSAPGVRMLDRAAA